MLDCAAPSPTLFHSLVSSPISPPRLPSPHHAPRPSHRFRRKCLIQRSQDPMEDSLSIMPKTLSKPKMPYPTKPDPTRRRSAPSPSMRPLRQRLLRSAILDANVFFYPQSLTPASFSIRNLVLSSNRPASTAQHAGYGEYAPASA